VGDLITLEAVATLSFFADNVKDGVYEFCTFGVVTLSPVVTGTRLSKYKVVWTEELAEWASTDGVHGTWLKIHKDGSWDVATTSSFIKVNVNSFELKV
jgi:hypothetical protein